MNLQTIVIGVFGTILAVMLATTITWEVEEIETYFTSEPYTYEHSLVREEQTPKFLWFGGVTQVQFIVRNTDIREGTFVLNFVFDNGEITETKTETVRILAGEKRAVTMDSPLKGKSSVTLNIIPPNKSIPNERTVMKKVTVLDYIGLGWIKALFSW